MVSRWWRWLVGDVQRLGLWTLPLFLMVGGIGAVLAGTLAIVYYSQQVSELRREIGDVREQLDRAVTDVEEARREAVDEIERQLEAVREALTRQLPVEDPSAAGVVAVRATFPVPPPSEPPSEQVDQPSATPPPPEQRTGTGVAVVRDEEATFVATAAAVVVDQSDQPATEVVVQVGARTLPATVHSWDRSVDVALLRVDADLPVPEWRSEPVEVGERLFAVALTPTGTPVHLPVTVAAVELRALLVDLDVVGFLRGAPLVDLDGRLAGLASDAYRPYGTAAAVPIEVLCEQLLRCGPTP